ncbi:MAG: hypothetical protein FJ220_06065 [Kiritimatiellaceae bacterium]|nr:hypothetical protein [Kiritimatiellaceae bacterium]
MDEIRQAIECDGDARIIDLHVWQVGVGQFSAIVSIVAAEPQSLDVYRQKCLIHEELVHLTLEVQRLHGAESSGR